MSPPHLDPSRKLHARPHSPGCDTEESGLVLRRGTVPYLEAPSLIRSSCQISEFSFNNST